MAIGPAGDATVVWSRSDRRARRGCGSRASARAERRSSATCRACRAARLRGGAARAGHRARRGDAARVGGRGRRAGAGRRRPAGPGLAVPPTRRRSPRRSTTPARRSSAHDNAAGRVGARRPCSRRRLGAPARARRHRDRPGRHGMSTTARRDPRQRAHGRRTGGLGVDRRTRRAHEHRRRPTGGRAAPGPALPRCRRSPATALRPASRSTRAASPVCSGPKPASARAAPASAPRPRHHPAGGERPVPTRMRLAGAGRFRLAVPVRCSEACDVRLTVRGISVVRALPAGRTTTLRYPLRPRWPGNCAAARARGRSASGCWSPTAPATSCALARRARTSRVALASAPRTPATSRGARMIRTPDRDSHRRV